MKKQLTLNSKDITNQKYFHGGEISNPQKNKRPLGFRSCNHFVLKSSVAKGKWSFRQHQKTIDLILRKFAKKHHIGLISYANVGNHLHLKIEISTRKQYRKFIRAISSAIMMAVTGYNRWNKAPEGFKFWDYRPFSRIIASWTEVKIIDQYILKNKWQGIGKNNTTARLLASIGLRPHLE